MVLVPNTKARPWETLEPRREKKILQSSRGGRKGERVQVTCKESESKMGSDVSATSLKSRTQRRKSPRFSEGKNSRLEFFTQENFQLSIKID